MRRTGAVFTGIGRVVLFIFVARTGRGKAGELEGAEHATRLHSLGYNLLLVDYRGYGTSSGGKPSEEKVYQDAEAAWNYLMGRPGAVPQLTFIYGHSLGGAIAIDLAVRQKIETQKRGIPEGSEEWDILYRKYFEEESARRRR